MKTVIRPIGNSQGVLIPKAILDQLSMGRNEVVEIEVQGGALVLRKPLPHDRAGWANAAAHLAHEGDDKSVWPDFGNAGDEDLQW